MKTITFLMPHAGFKPSGGFKVVFEYANRFANDGFRVLIIHPAAIEFKSLSLLKKTKALLRYLYWQVKIKTIREWFHLNSKVRRKILLSLKDSRIPQSDYYVATAVRTAYALNNFNIAREKKIYMIQGFENWGVSDEYVYNSYRLGFRNIAISNWLHNRVRKSGAACSLIRNGFDFDYFKLLNSIEDRDHQSIAMLYHSSSLKGCEYGIKAIIMLKQKYQDLKVRLFGVPERPKKLPNWIEYYKTPDKDLHNWIYNNSAIYMAPSLQEGWGLTVGEAMICGVAIVCTDTLGFQEMVENDKNGIIVPSADSNALVDAVTKLIEDNDLRIKVATEGNKSIQIFKWENSYGKLKMLLSHN